MVGSMGEVIPLRTGHLARRGFQRQVKDCSPAGTLQAQTDEEAAEVSASESRSSSPAPGPAA